MIPYGRQFIDEEDIKAVVETLRSDFITQGPKVKEFEEKLARYCGTKYCVVFNSGTSALLGAYYACGISEGDEVITSPITFVATTNMILVLRARPVFVDVEPDTGNMDTDLIESAITENTKAIVPVHYAGHPVDMEKIKNVADKHGLRVIEDACHALGAEYMGSKIGSCKYSDATVFSFHPVKHITTGEGGAVLTNDEEIYEKLLLVRNHGINREKFMYEPDGNWYYEVQVLGFNFRLTDIQASLGISQLKKLDGFVKRRREIADKYRELFSEQEFFELPAERAYAYHSYHLFVIRLRGGLISSKRDLVNNLREKGVATQVHYIPVYKHPFYREMGYGNVKCPSAEEFYDRSLSIPIFPAMTAEDVDKVADTILRACAELIK